MEIIACDTKFFIFFHFHLFFFIFSCFFSPVLKICFFFGPQLLHDFLQHFFTKIIFTSHLGEYSFEASFSFVLGFAMRTSIVLLSLGSRRPHFSSFSHVFFFLHFSLCFFLLFFMFLHLSSFLIICVFSPVVFFIIFLHFLHFCSFFFILVHFSFFFIF